ncbi:MAG: hypothetical protein H7238_00130, partial [Polaromonas sp.]|nr:hypothetical protein [Polaromonas sp.]
MPRGVLGPDTFTTVVAGPGRQAPDLGTIITMTAVLSGSGAVNANVQLEGSNDGAIWFAVGASLNLTGTAPQTGSAVRVQFSYAQYRAN